MYFCLSSAWLFASFLAAIDRRACASSSMACCCVRRARKSAASRRTRTCPLATCWPSCKVVSWITPETLALMVAWVTGASEPDRGRLMLRARASMAATSPCASSCTGVFSCSFFLLACCSAALAACCFDCITVQPPPARPSTTRIKRGVRQRRRRVAARGEAGGRVSFFIGFFSGAAQGFGARSRCGRPAAGRGNSGSASPWRPQTTRLPLRPFTAMRMLPL
ncbi:hypothetical protein JAB2_16660 [Janthinobacterium sp. HH100]|nr:hypothetical protein JAB2_16660 [Janthinobacterium sp. HH100]